jgi:hypothetical protein
MALTTSWNPQLLFNSFYAETFNGKIFFYFIFSLLLTFHWWDTENEFKVSTDGRTGFLSLKKPYNKSIQ